MPIEQFNLAQLKRAVEYYKSDKIKELPDEVVKKDTTRIMNGMVLRTWGINMKSYRIRYARSGKLQENISGLLAKSPPHEEFGRCNSLSSSVFYAANNLETALTEAKVDEGKLYQVVTATPKSDKDTYNSIIIGWLDYYIRHKHAPHAFKSLNHKMKEYISTLLKDPNTEELVKQVMCDAFFSEQFRLQTRENYEYRSTAYFCDAMLSSEKFDQIIYPSVANYGGWNIAIKAEKVLVKQDIDLMTIHIDNSYGFGLYNWTKVHKGTYDFNGDIHWEKV